MTRRLLAIALAAALIAAALAAAAGAVTKHTSGSIDIPAGATRALSVPFPDALRYGNARRAIAQAISAEGEPAS